MRFYTISYLSGKMNKMNKLNPDYPEKKGPQGEVKSISYNGCAFNTFRCFLHGQNE